MPKKKFVPNASPALYNYTENGHEKYLLGSGGNTLPRKDITAQDVCITFTYCPIHWSVCS